MNKEDADACLKFAHEALRDADLVSALKWARKACRLHDSAEARSLLETLEKSARRTGFVLNSADHDQAVVGAGEDDAAGAGQEPPVNTHDRRGQPSTPVEDAAGIGASGKREADAHAKHQPRSNNYVNTGASHSNGHSQAASEEAASAASHTRTKNPQPAQTSRQRSSRSPSQRPSTSREDIAEILNARDLYRVLSVERNASDDDLRRAYRRLALRFHPDKNSEPGADAAFKRIAHAFQTLSNPDRRRLYDQTGIDDEQSALRYQQAQAQAEHHADVFFMTGSSSFHGARGARIYTPDAFDGFFFGPGEMSAEELFEAFFYGGFGAGMPMSYLAQRRAAFLSRARQQRQRGHPSAAGNAGHARRLGMFWHFMPFLIFLFLPYILSALAPLPSFVLEPQGAFRWERRTTDTNLPYFVRDEAHKRQKEQHIELERRVEREWLQRYADSCRARRREQAQLLGFARRAWTHRSRTAYENAAEAVPMHDCESFEHLRLRLANKSRSR